MKATVSVGGKPTKNVHRSVWNWVGKLHLNAQEQGDQFILAALNRALFGNEDEAIQLRKEIIAEAEKCQSDHEKMNSNTPHVSVQKES